MHAHLTRELFQAVASGWRNPGDLAGIALAHLFELCPDCRRGFEAWREELEDSSAAPEAADYDAVIDRIRARVKEAPGRGESQVQSEIRRARSRAGELLRLSPEHQADWIRSESERLRGPLLADVLIEEGYRRTPGYPHDGYTLASLARLVLHHLPTSIRASALYARALAHMANAVRVIGDFPRAEQLLWDARYLLRSQGGGDRLLSAELDSLEGSLRNNQYRPHDSVTVLLRAHMVYRLEGLKEKALATLLLLGKAHGYLGETARSFELLEEAEAGLRTSPEPRLLACADERRAKLLVSARSPEAALDVLASSDEWVSRHGDPVHRLRRLWFKGSMVGHLGSLDVAEQALRCAKEGFLARRMVDEVARIRLELAAICSQQGRFAEAQDLAEQAEVAFVAVGLRAKAAEAQKLRWSANRG